MCHAHFKLRIGATAAALILGASPLFGQSDVWRPSARTLGVSSSESSQFAEQTKAIPSDVDEMLSWLPPDTESVIFARGPYLPLKVREVIETRILNGKVVMVTVYYDRKTGREMSHVAPMPAKGPTLRRDTIDTAVRAFGDFGSEYTEQIVQQPIKATIAAARRFKAHTGTGGGITYEGCHIIVFAGPFREGPRDKKLDRAQRLKIVGVDVVAFTTIWASQQVILYFAHPTANVLAAATDLDFLTTVLTRMSQPEPSRALPPQLPEWKYVDARSAVWGIRHVDGARLERSRAGKARSDGYGSTFSLDERASMVVVRCLSAHGSPDKRLKEFAYGHFPDDRDPPIRFVAPGVAETRFHDRAKSPSGQVTSHLMGWAIAP